jgi:hypothetical protein
MSLGSTNFIGSPLTSVVMISLITLLVFIFVKTNDWDNTTRRKLFNNLRVSIFLAVIWLVTIYIMALRHGFIVKPPLYGDGYYFLVVAAFFYCIVAAALVQINPSLKFIVPFITTHSTKPLSSEVSRDLIRKWAIRAEGPIAQVSLQKIVMILVVVIMSSNFINIRLTRESLRERVMGADWVTTQLQIQDIIVTQKMDKEYSIYEPIYLKHKYFIDSYKKDAL